jgi:hypothetical protein
MDELFTINRLGLPIKPRPVNLDFSRGRQGDFPRKTICSPVTVTRQVCDPQTICVPRTVCKQVPVEVCVKVPVFVPGVHPSAQSVVASPQCALPCTTTPVCDPCDKQHPLIGLGLFRRF